MNEQTVWKIIDSYFHDNPQALVNHHVESYNDFLEKGIFQIFREKNPLKWMHSSQYDEKLQEYRSTCTMFMGGKDGSKIYFGKPVLYDRNQPHYMFPNESRLRNITYSMTIHYDIEIEFLNILPADSLESITEGDFSTMKGGEEEEEEEDEQDGGAPSNKSSKSIKKKGLPDITPSDAKNIREYISETIHKDAKSGIIYQKRLLKLERVYLGKFPIMAQSHFCILHGVPRETRYAMGECKNDPGGYFIIDGKEKVVVPQEKFADNMLYIRKGGPDSDYMYSAEIKSVSENVTKPVRTLSIHWLSPSTKFTMNNIVVNIPNVRKPVPLFVLFRALGILSDRDILSTILLDMDKYADQIDLFIPSIHDAGLIYTQRNAIEHIGYLTKGKKYYYGLEVLADYFLPHVGETNYREKAFYLGYMVFRMISVHLGWELPTDRDNFKYKRLELVGKLMHDLFSEYYHLQLKRIHLAFERQLNLNEGNYATNLPKLIQDFQRDVFREEGKIVEDGFKKAFKGNWGAYTHTKRVGVIQDLNRLSYNTMISHMRKTNLPMDASLKIVGPRLLHNSQWGFIDPVDTPDGGNIGFHKNLAIATVISRGYSREPMIAWLREMIGMRLITDHVPFELIATTKIFVNGFWAGCILDPIPAVQKIRTYRRNAMIPIHTSVTFDFKLNIIFIYTDAGRWCRPIFYTDEGGRLSCMRKEIVPKLTGGSSVKWSEITQGFHTKKTDIASEFQTKLFDRYEGVGETIEQDNAKLTTFLKEQAIVDYIDNNESEHAYIAINPDHFISAQSSTKKSQYTHCEIHESLILGVMGNQISFPEMNPLPRDLFSCGQSKQACSLYHTNYTMRMDKTATVLHYGQIPLVKPRYNDYINREEHPYGFNAIVAVACYTGYNVEDAVLINAASLARGMFRTTYFSSYSAHEERGDPDSAPPGSAPIDILFTNIEQVSNTIVGLKPGYDYSQLDSTGLVREGTPVNEKTILIGMTSTPSTGAAMDRRGDMSVGPKKGQLGYVDKTYMTEGDSGERLAKVRVREERIPAIGDKFASRVGQKGTIGMVIPECDMPFTKDGMRPDMIINPHALPSRMTIGQLVESLTGKACTMYGSFADCTAFGQKGSKIEHFGRLIQSQLERDKEDDVAYESYGNEILYNGMTGEQMESSIFIGPVYYMRLKHMVKDKQQSRCLGPRSALTKQPVGGRANDGGLRIGEMERDSVVGHGAIGFLNESMMERGDKYYMAICNQSGLLAIYNPTKNLFMSPMSDGPLKFFGEQLRDATQLRMETVTKFGRNFSIVEIPYAFKLMMQELQAINVYLRIITEDNIQQLESLSYSRIPEPEVFLRQLRKITDTANANQGDLHKRVQDAVHSLSPEYTPPIASTPSTYELPKSADTITTPSTPDSSPPFTFATPPLVVEGLRPSDQEEDPWTVREEGELPPFRPSTSTVEGLRPSTSTVEGLRPSTVEGLRPSTIPTSNIKISPEQPGSMAFPRNITGIPEGYSVLPEQTTSPGTVSFQKRQFVYLQGDKKPQRNWMIDDIVVTPRGNKLYVLSTQDYDGLEKRDQTQVVKESRLIATPSLLNEETMKSMNGGNGLNSGIRIPFMGGGGTNASLPSGNGNFIFSPVMVGGNMGTNSEPDMREQNIPMMKNYDHPLPKISIDNMGGNRHMMMGGNQIKKGGMESHSGNTDSNPEGSGGKSWFKKALDFGTNLIVKKSQ